MNSARADIFMDILRLILTLACAILFSLLGRRIKIPAGAMIFAMLGVALLGITTGLAYLPSGILPILQCVSGAMIGHAINTRDVVNLKRMWLSSLVLIFGFMALNVGIGLLLYRYCGLTLPTALFASAPGGVSDMALIAHELGADTAQVSILQMFRLVGICVTYPLAFRSVSRRWPHLAPDCESAHEDVQVQKLSLRVFAARFALTLASSFLLGWLLSLVRLSAAYIVGGLIGSCAFNLLSGGKAVFPMRLRPYMQAFTGALIGVKMTLDSMLALPKLIIPVLLMFAVMMLFTIVTGLLVRKLSGTDLLSALMCCTPGGVQEMSILGQDLGCDVAKIASMHTLRIVCVICVFPSFLELLVRQFG